MDDKTVRRIADDIEQAKIELLLTQTFFGHLLLWLDFIPTDKCPTAQTDGRRVWWNPEFFKDMTVAHIKTIICHEVLHVAFGHHKGFKFYDVKDIATIKWKYACDFIVNQVLVDNEFDLPQVTLDTGQTRANLVFAEDFVFEPPLTKPTLAYSSFELYSRLPDPQVTEISICGLNDPGLGEDGEPQEGGHPHQSSDVDDRIWEAKIRAAFEADKKSAAMNAGRSPANVEMLMEKLLTPVIPWFRKLADWLQPYDDDYSFAPPDRRGEALNIAVGEELIWPWINQGERFKNIWLIVDTSSSMTDKDIIRVCSDVYGFASVGVNLKLMYIDARVQGVYDLTPKPLPAPRGRGGTEFQPAFDYIEDSEEEVFAVIYFTDGWPNNGWPKKPEYPVCWVITTDEVPPWGRTIYYTPQEMEDARSA